MQSDQRDTGYRSRFLTRWLPLYLVVGGLIYVLIYFVFLKGGSGGGGGY